MQTSRLQLTTLDVGDKPMPDSPQICADRIYSLQVTFHIAVIFIS